MEIQPMESQPIKSHPQNPEFRYNPEKCHTSLFKPYQPSVL